VGVEVTVEVIVTGGVVELVVAVLLVVVELVVLLVVMDDVVELGVALLLVDVVVVELVVEVVELVVVTVAYVKDVVLDAVPPGPPQVALTTKPPLAQAALPPGIDV